MTSLYVRIQRELAESIAEGRFPPETRIPSETALAERFGVSRMTVRHAMDGLIRDGLVMRRHGSGTYVVAHKPGPRRALNRLTGLTEDIAAQGRTLATVEVRRDELAPSERVRQLLELQEGAHVIVLDRLRHLEGMPAALHRIWLPFALAPELARRSLDGASLYATLEKDFGIRLSTARQRITAVAATAELASQLELEEGAPLIFTERLTRDANNRAVELAESWSIPDFELWIDLHR